MNIYEKLALMRCELQKMNLKKSGENKFAGYRYYELGDFLPAVIELCAKYSVCTLVSFSSDTARLDIVDTEKPDAGIHITSPMGSANLKGCHEVQNIGAVESYQRRYLYMAAFELSEGDAIDASEGATNPDVPTQPKKPENKPVSAPQSEIAALGERMKQALTDAAARNVNPDTIEAWRSEGKTYYKNKAANKLAQLIGEIEKYDAFVDDLPDEVF